MTRGELADSMGVTEKTIWRYTNEPNGLPHLKLGGRIYIRTEAALKWIAAKEKKPNPRRQKPI
jgi:hypothetical protein